MDSQIENIEIKEAGVDLFPPYIQRKINWFVFFLAFPFLSLLGNSVTFFIFLLLILDTGKFWKKNYKGKYLLFSFLLVGLFSTIFTPLIERHDNLGSTMMFIQYTYWIVMAYFFIVFYRRIDMVQVGKWAFYGAIGYTIAYYLIPFEVNNPIISLEFKPGRNAYVFNMLSCTPLALFYIKEKYGNLKTFLVTAFFLLIMLASNGRSGAIIILIQILLVMSIIYPVFRRFAQVLTFVFLAGFFVLQNTEVEIYMNALANRVESVNPRFASLLRAEGEGDLANDKSWLIRKLMIEKGVEIVEKHPFIGIGPNNFKLYDAELKSFGEYRRLQHLKKRRFSKNVSPHNTYIQVAAEFGLIGALIYYLLLAVPLFFFFRLFLKLNLETTHFVLISLVGISIHFYTISNLSGALPWFIIGLSWGIINHQRKLAK